MIHPYVVRILHRDGESGESLAPSSLTQLQGVGIAPHAPYFLQSGGPKMGRGAAQGTGWQYLRCRTLEAWLLSRRNANTCSSALPPALEDEPWEHMFTLGQTRSSTLPWVP